MNKEQVTDREAIYTITLFTIGTTLILGIGGEAKNDAWLAGILGIVFALPMLLLYSRLVSLYPGKDLFEMLEQVFGKYIGKLVSILYIWYAFHLGAMILRNFGEFVNTMSMPETPIFVPMLFLGFICIAIARLGVEVVGRTCTFVMPIVMFLVIVVGLMAIPVLNFEYIKPVLGEGMGPVLKGGFSAFAFPFAETVLFLGVLSALKDKKTSYIVYLTGVLFAGLLIVILTIRNILVLGEMLGNLYFPSHVAVSLIAVGEYLQRIEVTVAFVFIIGAFIKASICLLVASKGVGRLFGLSDYRSVTIQVGLLMIYFSQFIYDNIMEMRFWAFKVYEYYAFPFQVIIPVMLWIFAELANMRSKKDKSITSSENDTLF